MIKTVHKAIFLEPATLLVVGMTVVVGGIVGATDGTIVGITEGK